MATPSRSVRPARPLRLAVVSDAVLPWHNGGKEQRLHEMCVRLAARGVEVTVYTMRWWDGPPRTRRDGITYVGWCRARPLYAGERRSVVQAVVFALSCVKLLGARFDVVEADAIPFLPLVPVRLVTWVRRRPMVTTWHEFWGRDYWVGYLGRPGHLAARVEALAVGLPTAIIAASEETAGRLRRSGAARAVHVVPNGVDLAHLPVPTPDPARTTADGPTSDGSDRSEHLIAVGRLLENKRIDLAIEAVRVLTDRGRRVVLDVIGRGPERERLEAQAARLGLTGTVRFLGVLDKHREVLAAMAAADVLVFPSVREGFGMVALEAMAVGTPVVTSDHVDNAARHLVRNGVNGHLAADDALSLADAIEATLDARAGLAVGARETASAYDWERLADDAAAVYHGAAHSSGGSDGFTPSGTGRPDHTHDARPVT